MVYYPQHLIDAYNNALTCIYVIAGLLTFIVFLAFCSSIYPEPTKKLFSWFRRLLGIDKVVNTVYSDKSKNYSETEFLPVPSKAPTNSHSFEFLGWNKYEKDQNGNFVTKPIFLKKVKTCVINVYDDKNNILETHEVEYGAGIVIRHKKVIKEPSKEFEYEFVGWDKQTNAFFENTEVHPVFKAKPIKFTYKFVMDDGKTVILEKKAIIGTPITCPSAPVKIDDENVYEFVGWKNFKRNMILDKDYVFEAMFEKKIVKTKDEKLTRQKDAIEVVLNDYKTKKSRKDRENINLKDDQEYKTPKRISVEKNIKETKNNSKNTEEQKGINKKSLLNGVIVEKNKSKKSKSN